MNNRFQQIMISKITDLTLCLILLCCISCNSDRAIITDIPTIRLNPKEAGTLKVSDFFDSYKLFEFKGILFNGIDDFMELGDKRIAVLHYRNDRIAPPGKLAIFDTLGNFLYQIGTEGRGPGEYVSLPHSIQIKKDSSFDIIDLNGNKYLNYSLDNKVNKELIPLFSRNSGNPVLWFNDTLLLTSNSYQKILNQPTVVPPFHFHLYSPEKQRVYKKILPTDPKHQDFSISRGIPYKINDTICIYSEEDACIYNILADTITPRYYFDKGKHTGFLSEKDHLNGNHDNNYILFINNFENNRYLCGRYLFNHNYYYYIHDKKSNVTHNYKDVYEDLVFMSKKRNSMWPSRVFSFDINSVQADDNYLYRCFSQHDFRSLIETLKNELSPEEWEDYRQTHPDIIAAYENYDEETCNPVVIGFKYK